MAQGRLQLLGEQEAGGAAGEGAAHDHQGAGALVAQVVGVDDRDRPEQAEQREVGGDLEAGSG